MIDNIFFPKVESSDLEERNSETWQKLAEAMTPSIVKVVEFAKGVPGFIQVGYISTIMYISFAFGKFIYLSTVKYCLYYSQHDVITDWSKILYYLQVMTC